MLQIDSVTQRFGELKALDGFSLEVGKGECLGLLGPNGAGKSTLMSLVAGLRNPTSGTVCVDGYNLATAPADVRMRIGYAPQHLALYKRLSAEQNLQIFGRLQGLSAARLDEQVETLLRAVGLQERRRDLVRTFSGGMQRRLNLAAALLHQPALLLCDEPTVGVDPQSRNAIFEFLEMQKAAGTTLIYSTHYMEEAARLCSRIAIVDHGRLLACGTHDELLRHLPYDEEIAWPAHDVPDAFDAALADLGGLERQEHLTLFRPKLGHRRSDFYLRAEALGISPAVFSHRRPSLEAVFLHLTGRTLRD